MSTLELANIGFQVADASLDCGADRSEEGLPHTEMSIYYDVDSGHNIPTLPALVVLMHTQFSTK